MKRSLFSIISLILLLSIACQCYAEQLYLLSNNQQWQTQGFFLPTDYPQMPGTENVTYHYDTSLGTKDFFTADQQSDVRGANGKGKLQDGLGYAGAYIVQGDWWNAQRWGMVADVVFDLGKVYTIKQTDIRTYGAYGSTCWISGIGDYKIQVNKTNGGITQSGWQLFADVNDYKYWPNGFDDISAYDLPNVNTGNLNGRYVWIHMNAYGLFYQLWVDEIGIMGVSAPQEPNDCNQVRTYGYNLAADLNKDCYVNLKDVATLAQSWLSYNDPNSYKQNFGTVTATNSIFGVASHFLSTDVFYSLGSSSCDPNWNPEKTIPFITAGDFQWVREALYESFFADTDGTLKSGATSVIDYYLSLYDATGNKIILTPMWNYGDPAAQFDSFFNWVGDMANKHACVAAVELHNEANLDGFYDPTQEGSLAAQHYVQDCAAAYPILKAKTSKPVLGGCFAGWGYVWGRSQLYTGCAGDQYCINLKWAQLCLDNGLVNYCDAISCHPYRTTNAPEGGIGLENPTDPCGFEKEMQTWWNLVLAKNPPAGFGIYFTEIGYSSSPTGAATAGSEQRQADYISRTALMVLNQKMKGLPFKAVTVYSLKNDGADPANYQYNTGLLGYNLSSKLAYGYYSNVAKFFENTAAFSQSTLPKDFSSQPTVIKSIILNRTDGAKIVAFWRMNQLQGSDADFSSTLHVGSLTGTVSQVLLHDSASSSVQSIGFTRSGTDLYIPLTVTARAAWVEIVVH